jgi:hypothetical protein
MNVGRKAISKNILIRRKKSEKLNVFNVVKSSLQMMEKENFVVSLVI